MVLGRILVVAETSFRSEFAPPTPFLAVNAGTQVDESLPRMDMAMSPTIFVSGSVG